MSRMQFAILDFETTGISPHSHRIIEIGLRDLGPQQIHGIRAADVLEAPTFAGVASELMELLRGRILAAHNAFFDVRFLSAELARLGLSSPMEGTDALCTMHLAQELLPETRRTLADCCAAFDIELELAHRALDDATATARLLASFLREDPHHRCWREHEQKARHLVWPHLGAPKAKWRPRPGAGAEENHFLERIAHRLSDPSGPREHHAYLALLDRCLIDRQLSAHEKTELVDLANELGLDRSTCLRLHESYFEELRRAAWEDHRLTSEEAHELRAVAELLGLSEDLLARALAKPPPASEAVAGSSGQTSHLSRFRLEPGDRITLTGQMNRERESWHEELAALGFIPCNSVTKKVNLVVAADTDSLSGKARKARDYGIPIVDEAGLVTLLSGH